MTPYRTVSTATKACLATIGLLLSITVTAADGRFWLPSSYGSFYGKLLVAADRVNQTERCKEVIRGELHQDSSTRQKPIFRIICRDSNRKSFAMLVDGNSQELVGPLTFEGLESARLEGLEQERLQREQELLQQELERQEQELLRQQHMLAICESELLKRTRNMLSVEWLTPEAQEADLSVEGHVKYEVPFDARDLNDKHLRYSGFCDFVTVEEFKVRIRPRR